MIGYCLLTGAYMPKMSGLSALLMGVFYYLMDYPSFADK